MRTRSGKQYTLKKLKRKRRKIIKIPRRLRWGVDIGGVERLLWELFNIPEIVCMMHHDLPGRSFNKYQCKLALFKQWLHYGEPNKMHITRGIEFVANRLRWFKQQDDIEFGRLEQGEMILEWLPFPVHLENF